MSAADIHPSPVSAWSAVDRQLRDSLPETTHQMWFSPLSPTSFERNHLVLAGPSRIVDWVNRRYLALLGDAVHSALGEAVTVKVIATATDSDEGSPARERPMLNPHQTFESLVIGKGNRVAHAASLAVAESPGDAYSPLFIYGSPGVGKTHLLNSIGNYIQRHHPLLNVRYTTAERFTTEFVSGLRGAGTSDFKDTYRNLDVLLIDDLQILEGKARTEEEFVHTFNALHAAGKQIVLTSDRPAAAMPALAQRLRDRLEWGLTVEIDPPDLRTRLALIWRMKSRRAPEIVDPEILREIANRSGDNARLLEGSITRVVALSSILSEPVTRELVAKALPEPAESERPAEPVSSIDADRIREVVASHYEVSVLQIDSRSRAAAVARARQVSMFLCAELLQMSPTAIARKFDRDQSTVAHALRAIARLNEPGETVAGDIQQIRITLSSDRDSGVPSRD